MKIPAKMFAFAMVLGPLQWFCNYQRWATATL